jgi:hypothetical protein
MTRYADIPNPIRSGIVLVDPELGTPQRIIVLQFNPDTLERSLPQSAGGSGDSGGGGSGNGDRNEALRLKGPAQETWTVSSCRHARPGDLHRVRARPDPQRNSPVPQRVRDLGERRLGILRGKRLAAPPARPRCTPWTAPGRHAPPGTVGHPAPTVGQGGLELARVVRLHGSSLP